MAGKQNEATPARRRPRQKAEVRRIRAGSAENAAGPFADDPVNFSQAGGFSTGLCFTSFPSRSLKRLG